MNYSSEGAINFAFVKSRILKIWHMITRCCVFRGVPRISAEICRRFLPKNCVVQSARGYLMAIHAEDYNEACAICDCLSRHLTNFISNFLLPGDKVVDGGGNIGQITLLAASIVGPSGSVVAYEPNPVMAHRLQLQCKLNHFGQVVVRQAALGRQSGQVSFYAAENSQLSSLFEFSHRLGPYQEIRCEVVRLDDELAGPDFQAGQIALVKLDLEGGELEALKGMDTLLKADDPPTFMIELNTVCRPDGKQAVGQIVERFRSLGYQGFIIEPSKVYRGYRPPQLRLLQELPEPLADALFVRPGSLAYERVSRFVAR